MALGSVDNSSSRFKDGDQPFSWYLFLAIEVFAWIVLLIIVARQHTRATKYIARRKKGPYDKPKAKEQLTLAVLRVCAATAACYLCWLIDPKSYNSIFNRSVRNAFLRLGRLLLLTQYLFLVLYWQESLLLVESLKRPQGFVKWVKYLKVSIGIAFIFIVPSVIANVFDVIPNSVVTLICNAFFMGYTIVLMCAGGWYAYRLTSKLNQHDISMAASRSGANRIFRDQIVKIRSIIMTCVSITLLFLITNLWYLTTQLSLGQYIAHAYLQHFAETMLAFLAFYSVYERGPKRAIKKSNGEATTHIRNTRVEGSAKPLTSVESNITAPPLTQDNADSTASDTESLSSSTITSPMRISMI